MRLYDIREKFDSIGCLYFYKVGHGTRVYRVHKKKCEFNFVFLQLRVLHAAGATVYITVSGDG